MIHVPQAQGDPEAVAAQLAQDENDRQLAQCGGHRFMREGTTEGRTIVAEQNGMARCLLCRGRVTVEAAKWYKKGLMHARNASR